MQIIVDKLLTSYTEIGKGNNVLLLLHGWGDTAKSFEELSRDLSDNNDKLKIVMLNLPGFGGTQDPPVAWGLEEYASFTANFLNKLGYTADIIAGHSNGGAIAIKGIAGEILKPKKLILLASAGIRKPSLKKALLRITSIPASLILRLLPKTTRLKVRKKLYASIGSDYLVAMHMQDTFKRVVSSDVAEDAAKITLPVCLIYGDKDDATPVAFGEELAAILSNSNMHIVTGAGHFVHHDRREEVVRLIEEFIA